MRRYVSQNNAAGGNFCPDPNLDIAQDLGARADEHAAPYLRVPIARLFARSAQRDFVQQRYVVFHDRGLADDDARAVVDQYPRANPSRRMDVDPKCLRDAILEVRGQGMPPLLPQPVCDAVRLESVKTLVIQEWLRVAACRRVARSRRQEISADRGADRHILGQGFVNQVAKQNRGQVRRLQLVGQDHAQGIFQLPMSQHRGEQEADQHRFALRLAPSLGLNLVPESILGAVHQVFGQLVHSGIPPSATWSC